MRRLRHYVSHHGDGLSLIDWTFRRNRCNGRAGDWRRDTLGAMSLSIVASEFLYDTAPFPSCHAGTIAETRSGLVAAFFGGTKERDPDVCIFVCRRIEGRWTAPIEAANGIQADGSRQPCWNPVLFQPRNGPLMLFYKVGPSPGTWWGMFKTSDDEGQTWGDAARLPDGILGPIKNRPVQLAGGEIISPTSIESKTLGWRVYFERSVDGGKTWSATPLVEQDQSIKAIQPSILIHSAANLQAIGRTKSGKMFQTWSEDAGKTWSEIALLEVPNCNSGTDALTLHNGEHLLVYNDSAKEKSASRCALRSRATAGRGRKFSISKSS